MAEQETVTEVGAESVGEAQAMSSLAGKYLTFKLGGEEYGLEILRVTTIIGLMEITSVPDTPHYVRGVINLRGKVIPVVDMRGKFGLEAVEDTDETCVIVVEVGHGDSSVPMGILVDSVSEVLDIAGEDIEDTPVFGDGQTREDILGMAKVNDDVKILLDIDKVLAGEQFAVAA
jgi:purine-binding chemotaxis protein CheW